ncbi:MAG: toxin secretion, membrane fusion protein [Aridibacter sp.]
MKINTIEKNITKTNLEDQKSDFAYWQTKSYTERLKALEEIRQEYNNWKYTDAEQRFQRVYRIVKLKQS